MAYEHLHDTPDWPDAPVLIDVHCCNCRLINTWQVAADFARRVLGETVAFECVCGPGDSIGIVRRMLPVGEVAHA